MCCCRTMGWSVIPNPAKARPGTVQALCIVETDDHRVGYRAGARADNDEVAIATMVHAVSFDIIFNKRKAQGWRGASIHDLNEIDMLTGQGHILIVTEFS